MHLVLLSSLSSSVLVNQRQFYIPIVDNDKVFFSIVFQTNLGLKIVCTVCAHITSNFVHSNQLQGSNLLGLHANSHSALMLIPCPLSSVSCHQTSNHLSYDVSLQSGNWLKVKPKNSGRMRNHIAREKEYTIDFTLHLTMMPC